MTTRITSLLVLLAILVSCQPTGHAEGPWEDHTAGLPFVVGFENARAQMRHSDRPVLYFVTTTWCGWCKRLASDCLGDARIRKLLEREFLLVLVDGDTEAEAARSLGASGYPHVVIRSPQGRNLATLRGYQAPERFLAELRRVLGHR